MPQLTLFLGSTFSCHPISGNEGQGQQHYYFPMAQSGIFQTLELDPQILSGFLLCPIPRILLVTMPGLPTSLIYLDGALLFYTSLSSFTVVQATVTL